MSAAGLCAQTQRYLDDTLGPSERAASERHVRDCPNCKPMVEAWEAFSARYRESARALDQAPTAQQRDALLRKARAAPAPARQSPWRGEPAGLRWAFAVAGLLLVVGVAWRWRAPEPLPTFALGTAGARTPVVQDTVDATAEPALLAVGGDTVGLSTGSRLTLERRDSQQVRLRLGAGSVAAAVTRRTRGETFVVLAGGYQVTVVGTRFRVKSRPGGVRVEVAEGRVRVSSPTGDTREVQGGEALEWLGATPALSTFAAQDFDELSPREMAAPAASAGSDAQQADAGAADGGAASGGDAGTEEPAQAREPESPKRAPVGKAQLERWRQEALAGRCAPLLAPLRLEARAHPRQTEVWRLLADCLRLLSEDSEAASAYRRIAAVGAPEEADRARVLLAGLLQDKLGDPVGAERVLREYLQRAHPKALEAAARVKLARTLISQGKAPQAKAELQRVVEQLPQSPPALEALGLLKTLER